MSSYLTVRHSRSTTTLSRHRPRPSMLTATPADSSRPVHAPAVNCTPWSVLNTSGVPRPNASSSMSWQNDPSRVFDSRQATTYRLNQSIVAARYMNPLGSGMYVMSALHTWFTRPLATSRSRYGYTLWPRPADRFGLG